MACIDEGAYPLAVQGFSPVAAPTGTLTLNQRNAALVVPPRSALQRTQSADELPELKNMVHGQVQADIAMDFSGVASFGIPTGVAFGSPQMLPLHPVFQQTGAQAQPGVAGLFVQGVVACQVQEHRAPQVQEHHAPAGNLQVLLAAIASSGARTKGLLQRYGEGCDQVLAGMATAAPTMVAPLVEGGGGGDAAARPVVARLSGSTPHGT